MYMCTTSKIYSTCYKKKIVFHVTLCNQYSFGYVYVMSGCITVSKYSCVW